MRKRDLIILIFAMAVAVAVSISVFSASVVATAAWGLSFRQQGAPPLGTAGADQLEKFGGKYLGDPSEKVIYLTFDAGYENGFTGEILDTLKEQEVPAAFFLTGHYLEKNADLVRRMVKEGHIVGNHTVHHPDMSKTDEKTFEKELRDLEAMFRKITDKALPKFYRPPQGHYSEENLKQAQDLGYHTVFWSLAYADWNNDDQPDPEQSLEKLLSRTHNGAVVLLHATSKTNCEILPQLLEKWRSQGYRLASLEELFA